MRNDEFESLLNMERLAALAAPGVRNNPPAFADFRCAEPLTELINQFPDDPLWQSLDVYDWWRVLKFSTIKLPIMPDAAQLSREHWFSILLSQPDRIAESPYEWTTDELTLLHAKR